MGASCSRLDCVGLSVEECTREALGAKKPKAFWQDCGGSQRYGPAVNSPRNFEEALYKQQELEAEAQPSCDNFGVHHGSLGKPAVSWRRRYSLGRELGAGQTATVFEAFAAAPRLEDDTFMRVAASEMNGGSSPSRSPTGRRVALKRFHQEGTLMFRQELKALNAVGVHPHIVRLLESFEGFGEDDVIVLEHCDGGDIYELYAANNGCCMLESFVARLMRQLLLALQHLQEQRIEHRDVKPENLLLFSVSRDHKNMPFLKLADFGWAAVVGKSEPLPSIPPEGVGSLWYAPPELNPPVEGAKIFMDEYQLGKSDMWSVGVITYLLLTGHSPFNTALRVKDPAAREAEVIRQAAHGEVNRGTKVWNHTLSADAKGFIMALIRPDPAKRLSPVEALSHAFVRGAQEDLGKATRLPPSWADLEGPDRWRRVDCFQRLCWLALARAVAEPELVEMAGMQDFVNAEGSCSAGYLERLAAKLVSVATPSWFGEEAAWRDILYLAFSYLDLDTDGYLSVNDLSMHLAGSSRSRETADVWIYKWGSFGHEALPLGTLHCLNFSDFRRVLFSTIPDQPLQFESVAPPAGAPQDQDTFMEHRMEAIEEVCQRFLDEEFETSGVGF